MIGTIEYGLTHALLKGIISDDFERLCELFHDTMPRAASLRQLSFLFSIAQHRHSLQQFYVVMPLNLYMCNCV